MATVVEASRPSIILESFIQFSPLGLGNNHDR
jgi:hypothetical protein